MEKFSLKYGIDDVPPAADFALFSLQWLIIFVPILIIMGRVAAGIHYTGGQTPIYYLQKIFFVTALTVLFQVLWGHRLPLVIGPSSILLVGLLAAQGGNISTVSSSILIGGLVVSLISVTGIFGRLKRLFSPRVVAAILLLIPFTLAPTIISLTVGGTGTTRSRVGDFFFVLGLTLAMLVANRYLKGIGKATLIMWSMLMGCILYFLIFPRQLTAPTPTDHSGIAASFLLTHSGFSFNTGLVISFLLCFVALMINDFGSIQATGGFIDAPGIPGRITRGIALTGLANALSGFLGVIGPVDFSISPGVITSSGCASRYPLLPVGLILLALGFSPEAMGWAGKIPGAVIAAMFTYVMCSQIAAGILMLASQKEGVRFEDGLVVGLPLMLATIISFLPSSFLSLLPFTVRTLAGNGFVVGMIVLLILDGLYKRRP